jgi:peptidase M28-like protein
MTSRPVAGILRLAAIAAWAACSARQPPPFEIEAESLRDPATRILTAAMADDGAWRRLGELTDDIGARMSGSNALDDAIAWARAGFVADGQDNVHLEAAEVPHWVRGHESAEIVAGAAPRELHLLGLGGSIGTPEAGVTAELAVVSDFDELARLGAGARGRIVLYNHPMIAAGGAGPGYGAALPYRVTGADRASKLGAVAVLVRSLTARSLGVPHTGWMKYGGDTAKIPAAAVSVEDAELLSRLAARGKPIRVHLALGAKMLPDVESANVVAEIRGHERPDEIVVLAAHIDSWDVGQGAEDDGAGCAMVMEALAIVRRSGIEPRRTMRAILFTGEEEARRGAKQYVPQHLAELPRIVAAIESDAGIGRPLGFVTDGTPQWTSEARILARLLEPLGTTSIEPGFPGEDVDEMKVGGVPRLGLGVDIEHYFDFHHSAADTLDKIDPENLKRGAASLATMAFVLAERPGRWREPPAAATPPATPARPTHP